MTDSSAGYWRGETFVDVAETTWTFAVPKACSPAFRKSMNATLRHLRETDHSLPDRHTPAEQRALWAEFESKGLDVTRTTDTTVAQGSLDGQSELCFTRYETDDARRTAYRAETERLRAEHVAYVAEMGATRKGSRKAEQMRLRVTAREYTQAGHSCSQLTAKSREASPPAFCFCSSCDHSKPIAVTYMHDRKAA